MRSLQQSEKVLSTADSSVGAVRFLDSLVTEGEEPRLGAHIISPRRGYLHHGIYIGNGRVVHYAGLAYGLFRGPVEEASLAQFARGRRVWTRWRRPAAFDCTEIIRRALSRVGEDRYQILHNNCEHFCEWCIHGESRSYQVECLLSSRRALAIILGLIARLEEFRAPVQTVRQKPISTPAVRDPHNALINGHTSLASQAGGFIVAVAKVQKKGQPSSSNQLEKYASNRSHPAVALRS